MAVMVDRGAVLLKRNHAHGQGGVLDSAISCETVASARHCLLRNHLQRLTSVHATFHFASTACRAPRTSESSTQLFQLWDFMSAEQRRLNGLVTVLLRRGRRVSIALSCPVA